VSPPRGSWAESCSLDPSPPTSCRYAVAHEGRDITRLPHLISILLPRLSACDLIFNHPLICDTVSSFASRCMSNSGFVMKPTSGLDCLLLSIFCVFHNMPTFANRHAPLRRVTGYILSIPEMENKLTMKAEGMEMTTMPKSLWD
jgi:hypothetical protein